MRNFILAAFILLLSVGGAFAQKISGVVRQADGKAIEFATVTLHKAADSVLVKGAITGTDGTYEIAGVEAGRYFLTANVIGMGKANSETFDYDGRDKTLEPVSLKETSQQLGTVNIVARKPPIEVQADKTVLNVEGTVNSTGLNALELLRKAPGVTVDNNDNLSVKGKNNVRIMIDGREVPLDGKELAMQLKGMQAADIANIEIITNPSAKYDASGNAGIINVKLRKNKALGTNGNVSVDLIQGITPKANGSFSLNHRGKGFNVFGTYSNSYGNWHNDNVFVRDQGGYRFDQTSRHYDENRRNRVRLGTDWYINQKHTIGVLFNGSVDPGDWHGSSRAFISTEAAPARIDSILDASNDIDGDRKTLTANLNYRFDDGKGRTVNVDLDQGAYRIRGASYQPNFYKTTNGVEMLSSRIYRNNTPTDVDITTVKADYEQKLFKGKFGTGFKISDVGTDNTFDFFNVIGGVPVKDIEVSNRFKYDERTMAAYVNYNRMFGKKLNVQAGLRLENTDYSGDLISETAQNGKKVADDYTELFPSAAVTYTITEKIGLNATYSRRIDRPSYQDLNPFEFKLDELTYQKGNERLRPQFTNSFEISPTYQGYPVVTLGYSKTDDVFTQVLFKDPNNPRATFITQENIADQRNLTLSLNAPTPIAKWWDGFVSFTGFRSHFEAGFGEGAERFDVDQAFTAFNLFAEQNIKLPKGFTVQLSGWYNSRAFWGTLRSNPQGVVDLGISKKVFDNKGEVRLRFGDLFRTAGWSGENLFTPGLRMTARGTWEARTVTLNFSYRFGSAEVKSARQRKTGLEEEGKRVKN
jgi:iron complex outermembrane recepter protein